MRAVITGQQVGLFLGPLYTIYKAATAVVLARQLDAKPVFWLQTEDHDFAEIATCAVPRRDGTLLRVSVPDDERLARCSVAQRVIGADVTEQLDFLAELPHGAETLELLRAHYRPGARMADAFAGVLSVLFPELTIFDPRRPEVAAQAAPLMRRAISDGVTLDRLLEAYDGVEQVPRRAGTHLVFVHEPDAQGPRRRPHHDETDALLKIEDPMRFSTSALLRPIVQDTLFETAAYVGGPAELKYFEQIGPLYAHFGMKPPRVVRRASFTLVPPRVRAWRDKLGSSAEDPPGPDATWIAEVERRLDEYEPRDPRATRRTRETIRRAMAHLERRHHRALVEREDTHAARAERVRRWLEPDGAPQERVHSMPYYAALVGPRALAERIMAAVDPANPSLREIDL